MKLKIYKLCSILLIISMIFTGCSSAKKASYQGKTVTYYVSPNGLDSNDGSTPDKAFKTINAAVKAATDCGAGDTVCVKAVYDSLNNVEWGSDSVPKHDFRLYITTEGSSTATIFFDSHFNGFNGPMAFKNIYISTTSGIGNYMTTNSNDILVGENVKVFNYDVLFLPEGTWTEDINLSLLGGNLCDNHILGGRNSQSTVDCNLNVTIDNELENNFLLGDRQTGLTTFNKNINFNIKNSGYLTIKEGKCVFAENSTIQIINSEGGILGETINNVKNMSQSYYILNNNLEDKGEIAFTKDAGIYTLSGVDRFNWNIVVKKDDEVVLENLTDKIDLKNAKLGAGVYTIEAEKRPGSFALYYVDRRGSDKNDGTSADKPLKTIAKAIELGKQKGLTSEDIVYVKLNNNGKKRSKWGEPLSSHEFKLHILSDNKNQGAVQFSDNMSLAGPTVFENVIVYSNKDKVFDLAGNFVEFTDGAHLDNKIDFTLYNTNTERKDDINVYFGSSAKKTLYLGGNNVNHKMNANINILVDNDGNNKFVIGNNEGSALPTYSKNINFNIKNSTAFTLGGDKCKFEKGSAIQIVNTADIDLTDVEKTLSNYKNTASEQVPYYILNGDDSVANLIEFTDTAGVYKVINNGIIVAQDTETKKEIVSVDGVLSLEKNKVYKLTAVDKYENDGEKIKIYKNISLDLSTQKYKEADGKLFIGWQKSDSTWAKLKDDYKIGDVLTAKYIDFKQEEFKLTKFDVTQNGGIKLNLGYANISSLANIPNISEKGVIWVETDVAAGREIRLDQNIVKSWSWDIINKNSFTPKETLSSPNKSVNTDTAAIKITPADYSTFYTARGYIKYLDNNGVENIIYTEEETSSAYKVAMEAETSKPIFKTIIKKVKADNKAYVNSIKEEVVSTFDKNNPNYKRNTDSYDVFSNVTGAGDYIARKRTTYLTNTGIKESINLGWLTDMHLFHLSETDIDQNAVNAFSHYRSSGSLNNDDNLDRAIAQINYVSRHFDKTIVTGDSVDVYTNGSYNALKALIADKSVKGSILMTTGNHEFYEWSNARDIPNPTHQLTLKDFYKKINATWPNEPTYYEEILKTSTGQDNAMIVLLDNGRYEGQYAEGTAEKLQKSINTAKAKKIPILLFQHIATSTYNETETKVYWETTTEMGFVNKPTDKFVNLSEYFDMGEDVFTLIRKNSDVIKGIFCGHEHIPLYTEITALDEDGKVIPDKYIPQFLASGYRYYWVNEIVVK